MKKIIVALLVIAAALCLHGQAGAKTVSELQKEQTELRAKEREAESRLSEIRAEKKTITSDIETLDIEIQLSEDQLAYIHSRLDNTRAELDNAEKELAEAEMERENHYQAFRKRLKYIQEYGKIGYVQVLLNSKSIGDFLNRIEYVNDIITYDRNMNAKLEDIELTISEKRETIDFQLRSVGVLLMEEEEKMLSLEQSKTAKQLLLAEVENDETMYNQQIKEMEQESEALAAKIRTAQEEAARAARAAAARSANRISGSTGTGAAPSGQYNWPVPGYYSLSSGYKNRTNPITGRAEFHTGIDIPAPRGTNIVAAEAGTIILAGSNGGYGICVVVDHGNGVSTLYGHNSSLVVSVGDYVTRGQTIAKCGSTGMSTGNHCHFEVRINGSPVAPGPYVGL